MWILHGMIRADKLSRQWHLKCPWHSLSFKYWMERTVSFYYDHVLLCIRFSTAYMICCFHLLVMKASSKDYASIVSRIYIISSSIHNTTSLFQQDIIDDDDSFDRNDWLLLFNGSYMFPTHDTHYDCGNHKIFHEKKWINWLFFVFCMLQKIMLVASL